MSHAEFIVDHQTSRKVREKRKNLQLSLSGQAANLVHYTRFIDEKGENSQPLPKFARQPEQLVRFYRAMRRVRTFDLKAVSLQRTGQLGTYSPTLGQEAVGIGIGAAMRPEDVLLPTYREIGAMFERGVTMTDILLYWGGDERGMDYAVPRDDFPICVPIASHIPQAVGVAYAFQFRSEPRVAVCVFGDGASSKGDFYEAINAAGVWKLPVVFVVVNNQWAISMPRDAQTAAQTLAQKAIAAGFNGEQVDGNDVIAVKHVVSAALKQARAGGGSTLIEALTYRMSDHTTADDASRYRREDEVDDFQAFDPLRRLRKVLMRTEHWNAELEQALTNEIREEVDEAVKQYLDTPAQPPESMFDYLYAELPASLQQQRDQVIQRGTRS